MRISQNCCPGDLISTPMHCTARCSQGDVARRVDAAPPSPPRHPRGRKPRNDRTGHLARLMSPLPSPTDRTEEQSSYALVITGREGLRENDFAGCRWRRESADRRRRCVGGWQRRGRSGAGPRVEGLPVRGKHGADLNLAVRFDAVPTPCWARMRRQYSGNQDARPRMSSDPVTAPRRLPGCSCVRNATLRHWSVVVATAVCRGLAFVKAGCAV